MTCIVGVVDQAAGVVWIGGDRAAVEHGCYIDVVASPKVFRRGDYVIGYTSSFRMGQIIQYHAELPPVPMGSDGRLDPSMQFMVTEFIPVVRQALKDFGFVEVNSNREKSGVFMVGIGGKLFIVDDDFHVRSDACGFSAVGSGTTAALGALYALQSGSVAARDRAWIAVEAAEFAVTTVRGPIDVLQTFPTTMGAVA